MEVDLIITQSVWRPTWLFLQKSLSFLWTHKNTKKLSMNKNPLALSFMPANYINFIKNTEDVILVVLFNMRINQLYR